MKDIILAGSNAYTAKTFKKIGEYLENAPDLNRSGNPVIHIIGDKTSLDEKLKENVIDTVIFVATDIPMTENSTKEPIPIDVELLNELSKAHPNVSFIVIVKGIEKGSQKLLRLYMNEHYNILYREDLVSSVAGLVRLIRSERTKEDAYQYCGLEGVPLETDDRKNIYSPEQYEETEDESDAMEDIGIDLTDFDDEEPSKPNAEEIAVSEEDEEMEFIPPRRKKNTEKPHVEQKKEPKEEVKKEKNKEEKNKEEKKVEKKENGKETVNTETQQSADYKLTLPAQALELVKLEVVSADEYEIVLRIPQGHNLALPTAISGVPHLCVLLNKRAL